MKAIVGTVKMLFAFLGGAVALVLGVHAWLGMGTSFYDAGKHPEDGVERSWDRATQGWKRAKHG